MSTIKTSRTAAANRRSCSVTVAATTGLCVQPNDLLNVREKAKTNANFEKRFSKTIKKFVDDE